MSHSEKAFTLIHGNLAFYDEVSDEWRYTADNKIANSDSPRICPNCFKKPIWCWTCFEFHDACLGHIDNVENACCGHGFKDTGYINWKNEIEFKEYVEKYFES